MTIYTKLFTPSYFAASVFWKASTYRWKSADYELQLPTMGRKYDEEFRQYLLHAGDFPTNATLWMSVINEERLCGSFFFPYGGREDGYYRNHFQFMGLTFDLFLGRLVPKEIRRLCLAHTTEHFIAMSAAADEMVATHSSRLARKSKPI